MCSATWLATTPRATMPPGLAAWKVRNTSGHHGADALKSNRSFLSAKERPPERRLAVPQITCPCPAPPLTPGQCAGRCLRGVSRRAAGSTTAQQSEGQTPRAPLRHRTECPEGHRSRDRPRVERAGESLVQPSPPCRGKTATATWGHVPFLCLFSGGLGEF